MQGGIPSSADKLPRIAYEDFRTVMDRRLSNIKGGISDGDIKKIAYDWHESQDVALYDRKVVEIEARHLFERYKKSHVQPVGAMPLNKANGVWRWMYCQVNGMASQEARERKLRELIYLARKYDVNGIVFCELGVNWSTYPRSKNLASWFEIEGKMRCTTSHNVHGPRASHHQQGGTGILLFHEVLEFAKKPCNDFRKLGRWSSFRFQTHDKHVWRLVVGYKIGDGKPEGLKTCYQQTLTFIHDNNLRCTPQQLWLHDFLKQVRCWRKQGERLTIFLDENEHILKSALHEALTGSDLGFQEVSNKYWPRGKEPNTFIDGQLPIDSVYTTDDVETVNFLQLPFHLSVGDHKTTIIDHTTRSLIGEHKNKLVKPTTRRVTTKQPASIHSYNDIVEDHFKRHRIIERLQAIENLVKLCGEPPKDSWLRSRIIVIHKQMDEIRTHAENNCRKILKPELEFSPPIQYWYDRIHAYRKLISIKRDKYRYADVSRAVRSAKRKGITDPKSLSVEQCQEGIAYAKDRQKQLRKTAGGLRKVHLRNCLIDAQERGDNDRVRAVKQKIEREQNSKMWFLIKRVVKDPRNGAVLEVEEVVNGKLVRHREKEAVEDCIQRNCEIRFQLAHGAPISKSVLADDLKVLSDSELARKLFTGSYEIPDDIDNATAEILRGIGELGMKVQLGQRTFTLTEEDFRKYWRAVNENTSSSCANLHIGHYKAALQSELITKALTLEMNVTVQSGVPPDRWSVALQCLLEKMAGVVLVEKLRSIQLYEPDFNWFNRWIFNDMAMKALNDAGFLPEEHFSQKEAMAEDAKFDKTLTTDLSRQTHHPMAQVSVDAAQCYDRVNHLLMSLVWFALLRNYGVIALELLILQTMTFFQRTGFGDSTTYFGGDKAKLPFCGLGQGNKGAPASWLQLSSILVWCFKAANYGCHILDPISGALIYTIGCLFVDDTDLFIWKDGLMSGREVWLETQDAVRMWASLLCATGGAVKAAKSFWYLLDYDCVDGEWIPMEMVQYDVFVPMPDGSEEKLRQYDIHHSEKTLGVFDSPAGGSAEHLKDVSERVESWTTRMKNGDLPASMAWTAYNLQLWPSLRFGLGTLTNDVEAADELLSSYDYIMLPFLGVVRTIKKGWRKLHTTFGGVGLFHLPTEQFICRLNIFMQHYHTSSALSKKLDVSLKYLMLQLGCTCCPFELSYGDWGFLSPLCWVKMFWRTLQLAGTHLHIVFDSLHLPREGDSPIMALLWRSGVRGARLASMNRCRIHLNAIFLSDIVTANGRKLQRDLVTGIPTKQLESDFTFPRERPSEEDWASWELFWSNFTYDNLTLWKPLGLWIHPSHIKWKWFYNKSSNQIQEQYQGGVRIYNPTGGMRTRFGQLYKPAWTEIGGTATGTPISVEFASAREVRRLPEGPHQVSGPSEPDDFWEFLESWGGDWMWDSLHLDDETKTDLSWLVDAVKNNTAVWVTDGSYDKKRAPNISGAGWLVHCTATGRQLKCNFFEVSPAASSFRAEMLGLCSIHIFILAIQKFYSIQEGHNQIFCDSIGALNAVAWRRRRIKAGAKCADVLRSIRFTRNELTIKLSYEHVNGHMDRSLLWHQMNLEQQLNCICDNLAKTAVSRSIRFGPRDRGKQLLPREQAAVFVGGSKQTTDFADAVRLEISQDEAKQFLINERDWTPSQFDQVDWGRLHNTLQSKPQGYRLWLSKQHSNFTGSRVQTARYANSMDNKCPSCRQCEERASHLCVCPDEDRTRLFKDNVAQLEKWMRKDGNTNEELSYWVTKYLLMRGTKPFAELGRMSPAMTRLATSQDEIGWRNFTEGRISKEFHKIQQLHLMHSTSPLNGDDWVKQFISRVLHITHSQWIYRNFTLHDRMKGYLRLKDRLLTLADIETLLDTQPHELPKESGFLLEMDLDRLCNSDIEQQKYWVYAMKAARKAGRRMASLGRRAQRYRKRRSLRPRRVRLGVVDVETQIRTEQGHYIPGGEVQPDSSSRRRPSPAAAELQQGSNKRLRKPD